MRVFLPLGLLAACFGLLGLSTSFLHATRIFLTILCLAVVCVGGAILLARDE